MANEIGCVICKKTHVPVKVYPQTFNGIIIAMFYCCDECVRELQHIKITKDEPLRFDKL